MEFRAAALQWQTQDKDEWVDSGDNPYVSFARARAFASAWGSDFTMIGGAGHINGDAGYGPWPDGEQLLLDFCAAHQA